MMQLGSIHKCLKIIELLSQYPSGLGLAELSTLVKFHKSTVHHILQSLIPTKYVYQDLETRKYSLGHKFLEISRGILDSIDVRRIAHDIIRELGRESGEAVHLTILREGKAIYIDKVERPSGISLATYVGLSMDAYALAGGKVLISELSHTELSKIYDNTLMNIRTKNTIRDIDQLYLELDKIRIEGYAIDNEELFDGIRCVAAPIRAGGKIIAALSISGSVYTMSKERINRDLIGLVMKTADKISAQMKW